MSDSPRPEPQTAQEKLDAVLAEFCALVEKGEYRRARELAKLRSAQADLAQVAGTLEATAGVVDALEGRRAAIRRGAEVMVGRKTTLGTRAGLRNGIVEEVAQDGISLATKIIINQRVVREARVKVAWRDLTYGQEEQLAGRWNRYGSDGEVVRAFLALQREHAASAEEALAAAGKHPLADYLRGRIEALRAAPARAAARVAEDAARDAWSKIETMTKDRTVSAAEARRLLAKLRSFETRHGKTGFATSVSAEVAEVRKSARQAFPRAVGIPADAVEFNGHWYKVYHQQMNWYDAKVFCERRGGHLATITSEEEQNLIVRLATQGQGEVYIGLTNEGRRRWEWVTGERLTYTNWGPGQPNNWQGNQHCVRLWRARGWIWDDVSADVQQRPACEWEF